MYDKHLPRLLFKCGNPGKQTVLISMTAHPGKHTDFRAHLNFLSKQLHLLRALHKRAPQRAHRLIAYKQNGTFRPPEIML